MDTPDIQLVPFPVSQYVREETPKVQIILHHTVSGDGTEGDVAWWLNTPERIATHFIIGRDGTIFQNFNSKYWAYHLGLRTVTFTSRNLPILHLDRSSISIELDSWGGLTKKNGIWYSSGNTIVKNITEYPNGFRGFYAFETYTKAQLNSLKELLSYFKERSNGYLTKYNSDMWDVSANALQCHNGIWSHVSFRADKSDCHPQNDLAQLIITL